MTSPYRFNVQAFVEHFRAQGEAIASVKSDLHRKILYCSALDPLARAVQGKSGTHRGRIVHLLMHHTEWSDAGRLSLFQLNCYLKDRGRTRYRLYREVKRRLDASPPRRRAVLASSPMPSELLLFAAPEELPALDQHTYAQLFYTYRNNLIHEYREPGYGTDWSGSELVPFYTNMSAFGSRELVFPSAFVQGMFEQALKGVETSLLKQRANPHKRFDFGSYWRAK